MFQEKGHKVTVFIPDFSINNLIEEVVNGVRVVRFLPRRTKSHQFLGYNAHLSYEFAEILRKYLEEEGVPDFIESQEYGGIAYYMQQFKLLKYPLFKDLNIIITCHSPGFLCLEYNQVPIYQFPEYWTGQMEKACIISADLLIAPSKYLVETAKKSMSWKTNKEVYLANPMQVEDHAVGITTDFLYGQIICFGKLAPLKGTFELLSYFEKLWNQDYTFQLHLVGGIDLIFHPEGRTMGELVKKKYSQFIDKGFLKLHGEMAPEQAKAYIKNAHVVVVPSLFDNLPYTVLEAMSWGKVVLASKQGGQSEVIEDGKTGFLFDHRIPEEFQKKLLHILGLSTQEIREIGEKSQKAILERFHPEVIYPKKMKALEQFLSSKQLTEFFPFVEPEIKIEDSTTFCFGSKDLLSVVIPFHNMGLYIEECINSIWLSDYPNKEIIIIDDGSTDHSSKEALRLLQEKYAITVYTKENEGLSATRNFGASKAKGQYLAFLDADDAVDQSYYSKAISVLRSYQNVHFVGCWVQYFEGSTGCWPSFNPEPPYLLMHNMINSSALVYKKEAFMQGGLNDSALVYGMEDWDSVISLVEKGFGGVVLPELLFRYRVRKDSMTRRFTRTKKLFLHKHIAEKHSKLYRQYGLEIAQLSTNNGSGLDFDNPTFGGNSAHSLQIRLKKKFGDKLKRSPKMRKIAYFFYKKIN